MNAFWALSVLVLAGVAYGDDGGDTSILPIPTSCPPIGYVGRTMNLQHEWNCSWFYSCSNGRKVLMKCPKTLVFNPILQVCDWPYNVKCKGASGSTTTPKPCKGHHCPPGTRSTTRVTRTPRTTTEKRPVIPPKDPDCPFPDPLTYTVQLPYKGNCSRFWKCSNGQKYLFNCTDGLEYNARKGVCDWAYRAGCRHGRSDDTIAVETTGTSCPVDDPGYPVYLKHETDCNKFYECSDGAPVLMKCPEGLSFNVDKEVCDYTLCA